MKRGSIYIILSAFCWGLLPLISRFLFLRGLGGIPVAAMRCFITCGIFAIWAISKGIFRQIKMRHLPFYFLNGALSITGTYLFYSLAIERLSMAMASALLYTAPAFVIIFSAIIFKQTVTKSKLLSLILTFSGCCLVVGLYRPETFIADSLGIIYGLLSGLSYSTLSLFARKGLTLYSSRTNTIVPTMFAGLIFLVISPPWNIPVADPITILLCIALAVVGSVLPYTLYLKGMELGVEGGDASIIATLEPAVATVAGVLAFSDKVNIIQVTGMAVMLGGIVIAAKEKNLKEDYVNKD